MKWLRIIVAFLKVPRLFATLLLFPFLGAMVVVAAQLFISGTALRQITEENRAPEVIEVNDGQDFKLLRLILFGTSTPLPAPRLCVWKSTTESGLDERPQSEDCQPDRLDVALHLEEGMQVDFNEYLRLLDGNAQRLHVCKSCKPDLELTVSKGGNSVRAHSSYGLMVFGLLMMDKRISQQFKLLRQDRDELHKKFGSIFFFLPELRAPIEISELEVSLVFILNITAVVVIALWLGLKAHRKVLDYFSKSGALLPMVAATGKTNFYLALWGITGLRVVVFLIASVPLMFYVLNNISEDQTMLGIFKQSWANFIFWLFALLASMTLATLIASISDLKGRHGVLNFIYKVVPLLVAGAGSIIWVASFLFNSAEAAQLRMILTAVPVAGMGPMILAPVVPPKFAVILIHSILSCMLIVLLMIKNARWFAAHLEEI